MLFNNFLICEETIIDAWLKNVDNILIFLFPSTT